MVGYEFFVFNGEPQPASKTARSHAMRTALEMRSRAQAQAAANLEAGGDDTSPPPTALLDSQETIKHKAELKGRFRLPGRGRGRRNGGRAATSSTSPNTTASGASNPSGSPPREGGTDDSDEAASSRREIRRSLTHAAQELSFVLPSREGPDMPVLSVGGSGLSSLSGGTAPPHQPAGGYIDPFGTLPVPHSWGVDLLVKYFLTRFNLNVSTVDVQRPWFNFALDNNLVMHTTLALAAAYWTSCTPVPDALIQREGFLQKGAAMEGIKEALTGKTEISNAIVGAVANLVNVEAIEGSLPTAEVHLRGLERLVEARGGAMSFKREFHVARAINWVDIQVAAGLGRKPIFPLIHGLDELYVPPYIIEEAENPPLSHLQRLGDGAMDLRAVFLLLRQVVLAREHRSISANSIRILMNLAEVIVLNRFGDGQKSSVGIQRTQALLYATHVFLYAGLRQVPPYMITMTILKDRLHKALSKAEVNWILWRDHLPALIWALFVGAAASIDFRQGQGLWFASRLKTILKIVDAEQKMDKEGLKDRLRAFLWFDDFGDTFLDEWWVECYMDDNVPLVAACDNFKIGL